MNIVKHLIISGRVHAVGFRAYMQRKADDLGVTGWVRNRSDGTVEAVVAGTPQAVDAIIAWTHKGPPAAVVTHVKVSSRESEEFSAFSQRATE